MKNKSDLWALFSLQNNEAARGEGKGEGGGGRD